MQRCLPALAMALTAAPVLASNDDFTSVIETLLTDQTRTAPQFEMARIIEDICPPGAVPGANAPLQPVAAPLQRDCNGMVNAILGGNPVEIAQGLEAFQNAATEETHAQGTRSVDARRSDAAASDAVSNRQAAVRRGGGGGLVLSFDGTGAANIAARQVRPGSGLAAGETAGGFGGFVNGSFAMDERDSTDNEAGFESDIYGVTAGIDYTFGSGTLLGVALGYTNSESDIAADGGTLDSDTRTFLVYASYTPSPATYVDFSAGYTGGDYDQDRRIFYFDPFNAAQIDQTAVSETNSDEWFVSATLGYDVVVGHDVVVGTYGRVDYADIEIDAFTETMSNPAPGANGSGLALAVDAQSFESLTTTFGATITRAFGRWYPYAMGEYVHEFKNDSDPLTGYFVQDPNQRRFSLATDDPDRNFFNFGAGILRTFPGDTAVFARYQGLVGYEHLSLHAFEAGVRWRF